MLFSRRSAYVEIGSPQLFFIVLSKSFSSPPQPPRARQVVVCSSLMLGAGPRGHGSAGPWTWGHVLWLRFSSLSGAVGDKVSVPRPEPGTGQGLCPPSLLGYQGWGSWGSSPFVLQPPGDLGASRPPRMRHWQEGLLPPEALGAQSLPRPLAGPEQTIPCTASHRHDPALPTPACCLGDPSRPHIPTSPEASGTATCSWMPVGWRQGSGWPFRLPSFYANMNTRVLICPDAITASWVVNVKEQGP